jgi:hypothetical protein
MSLRAARPGGPVQPLTLPSAVAIQILMQVAREDIGQVTDL